MAAERFEAPLLDPFSFPSETKGRFVMLIMAALAYGANLGFFLYALFIGHRRAGEVVSGLEPAIQRWWGSIFNFSSSDLRAFAQQESAISRTALLFWAECLILPLLVLLLLTALATASYRNHPARLRLRYRTRRLTKTESPVVVADLENCVERFGLSLPHLEYSVGLAQGHAFGVKGNEILLLHGTPAILEKSWGETSRAIALHELAHIANADTHDREKARSLWKAFVIVLAGGVALLRLGGLRLNGIGMFQVAAMLIFVRALWAGLIRTRELYADWRVASWGEGTALKSLLALSEGEREPWKRWGWWWMAWEGWGDRTWWNPVWKLVGWSWRRAGWLLRLHPSFHSRRKVLEEPGKLFKISADLPLVTGFLLALIAGGALTSIVIVISIMTSGMGYLHSVFLRLIVDLQPRGSRDLLLIGFVIVTEFCILVSITAIILSLSYFAARTIGVQLQRNAVAGLIHRGARVWGYADLLPTAFLLAAGMEMGLHIAPLNLLAFTSRESWSATPLWIVSFTILLWLWLAYVHGLSRMLLGSYVGLATPRLRQAIVTWSSIVLLTVLCWPALLARLTLQALPLAYARGMILNNLEPRKVFIYGLFGTTLVVLILSLSVYLIWTLASMVLLRLGPLRWRKRCPTCKEETRLMLTLGRRCRSCGSSLASWIHVQKDNKEV